MMRLPRRELVWQMGNGFAGVALSGLLQQDRFLNRRVHAANPSSPAANNTAADSRAPNSTAANSTASSPHATGPLSPTWYSLVHGVYYVQRKNYRVILRYF